MTIKPHIERTRSRVADLRLEIKQEIGSCAAFIDLWEVFEREHTLTIATRVAAGTAMAAQTARAYLQPMRDLRTNGKLGSGLSEAILMVQREITETERELRSTSHVWLAMARQCRLAALTGLLDKLREWRARIAPAPTAESKPLSEGGEQ